MSLTYSTYVSSLANLLVVPTTDPRFVADLPNIIDDAEGQVYSDLDLLNTVTRDSSSALTAGDRTFTLPSASGTFLVTEQINVVTPAGTSNPDLGTRISLVPCSKELLDSLWPSSTGSTVPELFAPISQSVFIVGPWPNAAYQVEVVGTIQPAPLSASNTTTLLSVYFPDLMIAASMVRGAGLLKNYGSAVDDPKMAVTWRSHYQDLLASDLVVEARKKFTSQGWSSKTPSPLATPPRT